MFETMTPLAQALVIIGGSKVLAVAGSDTLAVVRLVRDGLPAAAAQFVVDSGRLTLAETNHLVLLGKTLTIQSRRGTLTSSQSDRLLRIARVIAIAEETFGGRELAATWLRRATTALDGERPLYLLDTAEGARAVETLLGRVAHGIAA